MGRVPFLFAGQGAQVPGMASDVKDLPKVQKLFSVAEAIRPGIVEKMLGGTQEELNRTLLTQPTMFLADLAYAYAKEEEFGAPACACGFSVGEVPALCFAGMLSEEDAFRAIVKRAELMEAYTARVPGCMIACVKLPPTRSRRCATASIPTPPTITAHCKTVVACRAEAEAEFSAKVKEAGGRAMKLRVSGMFHCPELAPEARSLRRFYIRSPGKSPVCPSMPTLRRSRMKGILRIRSLCRLRSPVRFTATVAHMRAAGVDEFVEVGPGKVLTGLVQRG